MRTLIALALIAFAANTSAQTVYQQKTYVFSGLPDRSNIIEDADARGECMRGISLLEQRDIFDINPNYFQKIRIHSVNITQRNGRLKQERGPEIGEMLICQDWQTYAVSGQNHVPIYYEVTIGGTKFRVMGGGTSPLFPDEELLPGGGGVMSPPNYPEPGVSNLSYRGMVVSANGRRGGMFFSGNLGFLDGVAREYYDHSGISVLQVLVPQK